MNLLGTTLAWFTDGAHWKGSDGIPIRILEHLELSLLAVAIGIAIALPVGLWLGHTGRGAFVAVNIANLGRALPSLALLALALPLAFALHLGLGFWPTLFALVPLTIPPILTNAYVAVRGVDREIVEAARGMGMRERAILRAIELPIALPLILAGIRTAVVNVIATATLGALVAGGGLGRYIVDGLALQEYERLLAGAILVAFLAIAAEVGMGVVDRRAVSPGIRSTA